MKALVIHPWRGIQDSHKEAFRGGMEASLKARSIEPVFLDLNASSSFPEANEELLKRIFELEYGDLVLWHGGSFVEVMDLVSYAMRILAPVVGPQGLPMYHFMPFGVLVNLPAPAWSEYCNNEALFGCVASVCQSGKEDITETDILKELGCE